MNPKIIINIIVLLILSLIFSSLVSADHITDLHVCDAPTANVKELVTVCYKESNVDKTLTLDSIQRLNANNQKPVTIYDPNNFHNLTFLYEAPPEGQPKSVSILLMKDVTNQHNFSLSSLSMNMVSGFRLLLVLDGQHYALSHLPEQPLFDTTHLRLLHIPTKQQFTPTPHPGTSWYLFNTFGDTGRRIALGIFGDQFLISPLEPGEAPAAYVTPFNLTKQYEVQFTQQQPVRITDPAGVDTLTICQEDSPLDLLQVQVCRENKLNFTLFPPGRLTERQMGTFNYSFLFETLETLKRVSIITEFDTTHLPAESGWLLDYNDFINNLVAGRRFAVKFNNVLYLFSHDSATLSLKKITAKAFTPQGTTIVVPAAGSEDGVEFPTVDGGKIFIKRRYGDPPPPFNMSALTHEQLKPVNLEKELSTSLNSLGSLRFTKPNLGLLGVDTRPGLADIATSQGEFKLWKQLENTQEQIILDKNVPIPKDGADNKKALFYYDTAAFQGTIPVKTAAVYLLYELKPNEEALANLPFHDYNDEFISVFTAGSRFAVKFDTAYYLLGYQNVQGQQLAFFDVSRLRLHTVDGLQPPFTPAIESSTTVSFTVPEGKIIVEANAVDNKLYLKALSGPEALLPIVDLTQYMAELTPTNRVRIGSSKLRFCFRQVFDPVTAAEVCDDADVVPDVQVDPVAFITVGGTNYLLEANGLTGENKKVFIRRVLRLNATFPFRHPDWFAFVNEIIAHREPIFNISNVSHPHSPDSFYLPVAASTDLNSFAFRQFLPYPPAEQPNFIKNVQSPLPSGIIKTGSLVAHDRIVYMAQNLTSIENVPVNVTLIFRPYFYLPDNRQPLLLEGGVNTLITFIPSVTSPQVQLKVTEITNSGLVKVELTRGNEIIMSRYFAPGDSKQITLNAVAVTISISAVKATVPQSATISIKRS